VRVTGVLDAKANQIHVLKIELDAVKPVLARER